jgi:hypothetical protein
LGIIQAGLDAREATHGAAEKMELRIFSRLRDSLAKNPGRAGRARGHARGRRKDGASYFFEMEGLSCEESRQGWTRARPRTGQQESWSSVFFRDGGTRLRRIRAGLSARWATPGAAGKLERRIFRVGGTRLRRIRAGLDAREATHGAAGKLDLRIFSRWRDSLAKNPGRAGRTQGHARGRRKVGASYFFEMDGGALLRRIRAGLQARWTTIGAAGILELRIF